MPVHDCGRSRGKYSSATLPAEPGSTKWRVEPGGDDNLSTLKSQTEPNQESHDT